MGHKCTSKPSPFFQTLILSTILLFISPTAAMPGPDYGGHPRFICIPVPADTDPACFPSGGPVMGPSGAGHHGPPVGPPNNNGWWGMTEEAKTSILHLRESLVQQKETILDMRETIRELTSKLTLCEGSGPGIGGHNDHHGPPSHHGGAVSQLPYADNSHHGNQQGHHGNNNHALDAAGHYPGNGEHRSDSGHNNRGQDKHATPEDMISSKSPEELGRMLQALKERMDNLQQSRNTSTTYSSSLKELLQRKISALEQQMHHTAAALSSSPNHHDDSDHHDDGHHEDHDDDGHHDDSHHDNHHDNDGHHDDSHHDDHPDDHHDDGQHDNEADSHGYLQRTGYRIPGPRAGLHSNNKLDSLLNNLHHTGTNSRKKTKTPDAFQIGFPMRTNYMYGKVKMTLLHEIFALTLCLWIKGGAGPGLGTPFSYSVPGQANELVLIEWGNNPMELLVDDKAVTLPLSISDGKWHHVCVTWSTRDGEWEAYQDGVKRGSGENLSAWHPIKPGGVFILGQEQDTLGGRFDATQAFMGDISDLQMWANVLTAHDIYSLASCNSHLSGDVITWSENVVELHGGVTKYPFDPCH
ncbi:neuronal pentraxin-1-like isoform X1 [Oncorhynchus kisutch]|uniref:Neuronal pentraxin-1-like n=1 Tax=Oncorhynchus kisutch TaxID=8019 RepID=A0A8C7IW68_ONCKI|nr:neuronal pentraxin-1-like isoform X1 [Oncorhynchus kisutch]